MAELSWKARRNGAIYCAPACGARCTWVAHQRAVKDATALARELGKGWSPRVHENLGWHFSATRGKGYCTVYRHGRNYTAYIGPNQPGGWWVGSGKTAIEAVRDGVRQAQDELAEIKAVVEFVEGMAA